MELAAGLIMVASTVAVFFVWSAQARHPDHWRPLFQTKLWVRALAWTGALTAAALAGALLGGGVQLAEAAIAFGFLAAIVFFRFWALAKAFGRPNDRE
jgi:hypothetical protein